MAGADTPTSPRGGRHRRYDDETERQLLLDAALRAMRQSPDGSISVNDVLTESSLTTRAFYRHFISKDALAETLLLRDVEAIADSLAREVRAESDPVTAVTTWLDGFTAVIFDPIRSRRASQIARVADDRDRGPSARLMYLMRNTMCESLVEALRSGDAAGDLRSPTPVADAFSIYELVLQVRDAGVVEQVEKTAADAKAHVARFAWPALGLA